MALVVLVRLEEHDIGYPTLITASFNCHAAFIAKNQQEKLEKRENSLRLPFLAFLLVSKNTIPSSDAHAGASFTVTLHSSQKTNRRNWRNERILLALVVLVRLEEHDIGYPTLITASFNSQAAFITKRQTGET